MKEIADEEKEAFNAHILVCQACAEEYEETKELMSLVKAHWGPISPGTQKLLEDAGYKVEDNKQVSLPRTHKMTVEEGWQDLCRRCPELAESTEKPKSLQLFLRIGAVAACLIIGILTWMIFPTHSKSHPISQTSSFQQVASVPGYSVKVELVRPSGYIAVPVNQKIVADDELKTLLINDKHRMVLNTGTSLSIEPLTINSNLGCLVKLNSGEIYTHVEHDGNPFVVQTADGKAIITGTTFNIKADNQQMELIVTEGTVRFENENGGVNVKAGQKSKLTANAKPTLPALCDVKTLTAWATGHKGTLELAAAKSSPLNEYEFEWPWPIEGEPIALEEVDYEQWLKEKQNWFRSEFPWIFQLQNALTKEGVEIDYPKLLIQSGDLWQFSYIKTQPSYFSILSFNSLLKAISGFGLDKQWLLQNVSVTKYALAKPTLPNNSFNALKTFERWDGTFKVSQQSPDMVDYDILEHLFRSSIYIANTRSLIWFAVKNGNYNLTDKEQSEVLALLQEEVNAAIMCHENALYQPNKVKLLCDPSAYKQDKWYQWAFVISKNIEKIINAEKENVEYKISK